MRIVTKFLRQYQSLLISVTLLLASLGGLFWGIVPSVQTARGLFADAQSLSTEVDGLRDKAAFLANLDENKLRNQLTTLTAAVPADKSIPSLFATVEQVANGTQTALADLSLSSNESLSTDSAQKARKDAATGLHVVPFTVTVQGSLPNLQAFIGNSVAVRRLLQVKFFDVSFEASVSAMRLTMEAFYSPLPTTIGSIGTKLAPLTAQEEQFVTKIGEIPWVAQEVGQPLTPTTYEQRANPFAP